MSNTAIINKSVAQQTNQAVSQGMTGNIAAQHQRGFILLDTLIKYFADYPTMTIIFSTVHED